MLEATSDSKPLTAVGDIFEMDMDRQPLGDTAMSKYKVRNWVTRIEPGHLIEWSGNLIDQPEPFGHIYGWRIDVVSDNECIVANYTEWSALPDDLKVYWPIVPLTMLEKSVENLERIVTTA